MHEEYVQTELRICDSHHTLEHAWIIADLLWTAPKRWKASTSSLSA